MPPNRSFWREFWPKALIVVAVVVALSLLERCGFIRRW
jgi:hypothetical protein